MMHTPEWSELVMTDLPSSCHGEVVPWWVWMYPIAVAVAITVAVVRTIVIEWRHDRSGGRTFDDEELRTSESRERRSRQYRWKWGDTWDGLDRDRNRHRPYD